MASRSHAPDGCRLVRDGNTAAVPPIAAVPEFGGIGKMKESPRIWWHSTVARYSHPANVFFTLRAHVNHIYVRT